MYENYDIHVANKYTEGIRVSARAAGIVQMSDHVPGN